MPAYVMVNADSNVPWPSEQMTVSFGGREILLIPPRYENGRMTAYPLAAIEYKRGEDEPTLVNVIRRFFNALVWQHQTYIRDVEVHYGAPLREGTRISGNFTTDHFDAKSLVDPNDSEARIALAFYREGLALKRFNVAYSFLSLFKVLNIRLGAGVPQKAWINAHASQLRNHDAVSRLTELQQTEPDIGRYLYDSGRCSIAHAFNSPVVDPNDIGDQQRLSRDWPLIRSVAALYIQTEFGVAPPPWTAGTIA